MLIFKKEEEKVVCVLTYSCNPIVFAAFSFDLFISLTSKENQKTMNVAECTSMWSDGGMVEEPTSRSSPPP